MKLSHHVSSRALQYVHGVALRHHFQRVCCRQFFQASNDLCEAGPLIWIWVQTRQPQLLQASYMRKYHLLQAFILESAEVTDDMLPSFLENALQRRVIYQKT